MKDFYVVPTPIGNLEDLTFRAKRILEEVSIILCEDTLYSTKLVRKYNSSAKLISLHKFNELSRIEEILKLLETKSIALISDAGTPTINDPGQLLIKELVHKGIKITPLPGASAITTALSGSGLEFSIFAFIGFFPKKEKQLEEIIYKYLNVDLIIGYESPNRILKTLAILEATFGDIEVCLARELTKLHEEILTTKISILRNKTFKGEIVLLIPTKQISLEDYKLDDLLKIYQQENLSNKTIVNIISKTTNFKKNQIYERLKKDE